MRLVRFIKLWEKTSHNRFCGEIEGIMKHILVDDQEMVNKFVKDLPPNMRLALAHQLEAVDNEIGNRYSGATVKMIGIQRRQSNIHVRLESSVDGLVQALDMSLITYQHYEKVINCVVLEEWKYVH